MGSALLLTVDDDLLDGGERVRLFEDLGDEWRVDTTALEWRFDDLEREEDDECLGCGETGGLPRETSRLRDPFKRLSRFRKACFRRSSHLRKVQRG